VYYAASFKSQFDNYTLSAYLQPDADLHPIINSLLTRAPDILNPKSIKQHEIKTTKI